MNKLATITWYNGDKYGYISPNCPCLAVCYENGRAQIMRNEADTEPILIDTLMTVRHVAWDPRGTVLAFAGSQQGEGSLGETGVNVVQFYTPFGINLRTLKLPGKSLRSLSWEGGSRRLALAVDHFIYFATYVMGRLCSLRLMEDG